MPFRPTRVADGDGRGEQQDRCSDEAELREERAPVDCVLRADELRGIGWRQWVRAVVTRIEDEAVRVE